MRLSRRADPDKKQNQLCCCCRYAQLTRSNVAYVPASTYFASQLVNNQPTWSTTTDPVVFAHYLLNSRWQRPARQWLHIHLSHPQKIKIIPCSYSISQQSHFQPFSVLLIHIAHYAVKWLSSHSIFADLVAQNACCNQGCLTSEALP